VPACPAVVARSGADSSGLTGSGTELSQHGGDCGRLIDHIGQTDQKPPRENKSLCREVSFSDFTSGGQGRRPLGHGNGDYFMSVEVCVTSHTTDVTAVEMDALGDESSD
jgi:hypothetical protein